MAIPLSRPDRIIANDTTYPVDGDQSKKLAIAARSMEKISASVCELDAQMKRVALSAEPSIRPEIKTLSRQIDILARDMRIAIDKVNDEIDRLQFLNRNQMALPAPKAKITQDNTAKILASVQVLSGEIASALAAVNSLSGL